MSSTEWRFVAESKGAASFEMLVIPQGALSPLLAGGRLAHPFRLPGASPLGSLLGAAMDAAMAQVPLLPDELGEAVLRNLCGLVALACGASDEGTEQGRDSLRSAQLVAVQRHVDLHLADPGLTPASAAATLGVSVRQLHRLFEPSGRSFARYVLRLRLLRCRDTIAGATGTGRSVLDIAFGWGFNSMATFYRAFVSEFGSPPAVLRAGTEAWKFNPDIKLGMISYLGVPIAWPDGEIFGTICVLDKRSNRYSDLYLRLLLQWREVLQADLRSIAQLRKELEQRAVVRREAGWVPKHRNSASRRVYGTPLRRVHGMKYPAPVHLFPYVVKM